MASPQSVHFYVDYCICHTSGVLLDTADVKEFLEMFHMLKNYTSGKGMQSDMIDTHIFSLFKKQD
jgi:hypothetical protein